METIMEMEENKNGNRLSFEEVTKRLEEITEKLEKGDEPLEDALALFEEGMGLAHQGTQRLEQAERRIETLLNHGGLKEFESVPEGAQESEGSPSISS
jgi:exodeoxyribonuclease VII small subunit